MATASLTKVDYILVRLQGQNQAAVLPYFRDRLLLSIRASFNDEDLYNHAIVVATGNKAQIYYGEASDTDPDSPTRIEAIGDRVIKIESDLITTQQTANKSAKKAFLDHCLVNEDISLEALCNPALEGNDVVGVQEMTFSQIERNFRLQGFSIPLSSARQSLKLARIINLQTETISVNDDIVQVGFEQNIKETQGTSKPVNIPAGLENGDLLLLWMALDGGPGDTGVTVSGAAFNNVVGTNKWKYRFVTGTEPASVTASWNQQRRGVISLMAYRNVDPSNPIAGLSSRQGADGKTFSVPGLTLRSGEYHLVSGVQGDAGDVTYTFPDSWTEFGEENTGGPADGQVSVSIADKPRVGANPPSFSVTATRNVGETRYQIALRKDIS